MPTGWSASRTGTCSSGPRASARMARAPRRWRRSGRSISTARCNCSSEGRATAETLVKNGCPVRTIHLPQLNEETLGELLMHFMLETIIAAHLLGVDAFDQPAVEEGKVLAKKYLLGT